MMQFWRLKLWKWESILEQQENWFDGFSTFHVGGDGLVHLHVADTMMPDQELTAAKEVPLAAKVAALLGLAQADDALFCKGAQGEDQGEEDEEALMLPLEELC